MRSNKILDKLILKIEYDEALTRFNYHSKSDVDVISHIKQKTPDPKSRVLHLIRLKTVNH